MKSQTEIAKSERDIRIETLNEVKASCPFDGVYGSLHESIAHGEFMKAIDSLIAKYSIVSSQPQGECPLGGDETDDCADCAYSPDYHLVGDECVERTLENDKKKNMTYWDIIDDACYEAVRGVAASSQTEINEDELEEAVTEIGAEIRDIIVEKLTAIGGIFPSVDENY